jgi:hypothetical protein
MKKIGTIVVLTFITFGCNNKQIQKEGKISVIDQNQNSKVVIAETIDNSKKTFKQIKDYPQIKDSVKFITELKQTFKLEVDESQYQREHEKITIFKKVKINGSNKDYYLIEYDYGHGCMAAYPWKYQLILSTEGRLLKTFYAQRFEFIKIFQNQQPFLLFVIATAKGNGGHEIYKITKDTMDNIFDGDSEYAVQTYKADEYKWVYEPNELKLSIEDFNSDGFNDLIFYGKIALTQGRSRNGIWYDEDIINGDTIVYSAENPFKRIPIKLVFIFDKKSKHFKSKANYEKKFENMGLL